MDEEKVPEQHAEPATATGQQTLSSSSQSAVDAALATVQSEAPAEAMPGTHLDAAEAALRQAAVTASAVQPAAPAPAAGMADVAMSDAAAPETEDVVQAGPEGCAAVKAKEEAIKPELNIKLEPLVAGDDKPPAGTSVGQSPVVGKQEAANGSAAVSNEALVERLKEVLLGADMDTMTERQLRKQLEDEFQQDLKDRKAVIRAQVKAFLESRQAGAGTAEAANEAAGDAAEAVAEEEADGDEPAVNKRKGGGKGFPPVVLSEPLAKFCGAATLPRSQVVSKIWDHIKAHGLQDPKDRRKILPDEVLGAFLKAPVNMFSMNKQLAKHMVSASEAAGKAKRKRPASEDEESAETGDDDEDEDADAEPAPKKRRRSTSRKSTGSSGGRGGGGFTKPVKVSEELAEWLGGRDELPRSDITKYFWQYVKNNQLQKPTNKSIILSDDTLERLTGEKEFKGFGFQALFKKHILS